MIILYAGQAPAKHGRVDAALLALPPFFGTTQHVNHHPVQLRAQAFDLLAKGDALLVAVAEEERDERDDSYHHWIAQTEREGQRRSTARRHPWSGIRDDRAQAERHAPRLSEAREAITGFSPVARL